jgi:uncharacterized membrane protein
MMAVFTSKAQIGLSLAVLAITVLLASTAVFAAPATQSSCEGAGGTWSNGDCTFPNNDISIDGTDSLFGTITDILLFVTGAIAVIFIVVNAIRLITAQGDPQAIQNAKQGITYSFVGIVVAFLAWAAVSFVIGEL